MSKMGTHALDDIEVQVADEVVVARLTRCACGWRSEWHESPYLAGVAYEAHRDRARVADAVERKRVENAARQFWARKNVSLPPTLEAGTASVGEDRGSRSARMTPGPDRESSSR